MPLGHLFLIRELNPEGKVSPRASSAGMVPVGDKNVLSWGSAATVILGVTNKC